MIELLKTVFLDSVADLIQEASLIVTIVGLSLAWCEIKAPRFADRMENFVDDLEHKMADMGLGIQQSMGFQILITVWLFFVFLGIIPWALDAWNMHFLLWITFWGLTAMFSAVVGVHLLVDFIAFLNAFSNGHALGTIGIMLGFLGFLGEVYQVVAMTVN